MNGPSSKLPLPQEFSSVPQRTLTDFLLQYSHLLCEQFAPAVTEGTLRAFVNDVLCETQAGPARPVDVVLEFKHVCRFSGCNLNDCQLCRNNPSKVCEPSTVFDRQYWVRDDGRGGQLIKARCGADVSLALTDRTSGQAVLLPDVRLRLYVVSGQTPGALAATEPAGGLYLADDGHPLFAAAGCTPDDEGGIPLEMEQDDVLGAVAYLPELQFLDKNSKFKSAGRTYKAFKLLGRATKVDPLTGVTTVLAQVESETFKVTTKKGYDGCRKAEYLFAHQPITDKTFATLGETTISNLKAAFEGVETVEDLMRLVQASASAPDLQARLRDTLNMARDTDKWKKLTRMLSERVVWDDSIMRLFVVPTGSRPLGLLFRASKGQVDFEGAVGVVYQAPLPNGQLRAVRMTDSALSGCGRHLDALKQLAASYWGLPRHPGWTLAPEQPRWEAGVAPILTDVFGEAVGLGDPVAAAQAHWMQLTATLQPAQTHTTGSAGPSPLRSPTPLSSNNHAAAVAAVMAAADNHGLLAGSSLSAAAAAGNGGFGGGSSSGLVQGPGNQAAAATAGGVPGMLPRGGGGNGGGRLSPFEGSTAVNTAVMAAAATAGDYGTAGDLNGRRGGSGQAGGLSRPSGLLVPNAGASSGMVLVSPTGQPPSYEASPFNLPATSMLISGRTTSCATEQTSDTASHSTLNQQAQMQQQQQLLSQQHQMHQFLLQQQRQQQQLQIGGLGASAAGVPNLAQPVRTVSGPAYVSVAGGPLSGGPGPFGGIAGNLATLDLPGGLAEAAAAAAGNASLATGQQQQQQLILSAAGRSSCSGGTIVGGLSGPSSQQGLDPMVLQGLGLAGGSSPGSGPGLAQQQQRGQGPFASVQQVQLGMGLQQPQQQQAMFAPQQQGSQQLVGHFSSKPLMLQQAIVEGWPAPQVKALLDQMSDEELRQLVELHAASEAAAAVSGTTITVSPGVPGTAATAAAGGGVRRDLQGFGSSVPIPSTSGVSGSVLPQQQQQQMQMRQLEMEQQLKTEQQQQGAAAAVGGGAGAPAGGDSAAALAALFVDSGIGVDGLRGMSDVQLAGDQGAALPAGLLGGLDSFTGDISQWGDIFNDLRNISSCSGQPPGLTTINSITTDWIPELLRERASGRLDPVAAAAAEGGSQPDAADGGKQQQQTAAGQAGAAGAAAAAGGDGDGEAADIVGDMCGGVRGRMGKRERSKTGQAPTAEQRQEWQALFGVDGDNPELRSLSKAETHYDSFNRHFPVARLTSKTAEVQQGGQVSNPWVPGLRLSATGVTHPAATQPISPNSPNPFVEDQLAGPPMVEGSPNTRPTVTTDSPQAPEHTRMVSGDLDGVTAGPRSGSLPALPVTLGLSAAAVGAAGGGRRGGTPPLVAPLAQTEEGAAAVESVTGLRCGPLQSGLEGSAPSGGLRGILELMSSDAAAAADGLSSQRISSDAAAVAAAAAADNPFSVAAREPMHPPAPQLREASAHRDSFGRTGWISSLFRRSSSFSSKSTSGVGGSGGSGSGPSGGSHTSKDAAAGLAQTGSVRGPAAATGGSGQ